jgi:excisionase family DNA binding protein
MNEALRKALAEERGVDVPDLAVALGVSKHLLYRAIKTGEIRASRIGQRVTVPPHIARELLCLPAAPLAA